MSPSCSLHTTVPCFWRLHSHGETLAFNGRRRKTAKPQGRGTRPLANAPWGQPQRGQETPAHCPTPKPQGSGAAGGGCPIRLEDGESLTPTGDGPQPGHPLLPDGAETESRATRRGDERSPHCTTAGYLVS